jgi:hypothetical protein
LGNILGAKFIVVGTISKIGRTFSLDARLVNIESSESIKSANYTSKGVVDDLLVLGVPSVVSQLIGEEKVAKQTINSLPTRSQNSNDFLHYYKFKFDINPEYKILQISNEFKFFPESGLSVGYQYARKNGFGLGLEYQFSRSLDSQTDFGFNSIYLLYNYTNLKTKFGISLSYGLSKLFLYDNGEVINDNSSFENADLLSLSIRYPISELMFWELGSTSLSMMSLNDEHIYNLSYIGITFTLK